jgi:hypothetical protein
MTPLIAQEEKGGHESARPQAAQHEGAAKQTAPKQEKVPKAEKVAKVPKAEKQEKAPKTEKVAKTQAPKAEKQARSEKPTAVKAQKQEKAPKQEKVKAEKPETQKEDRTNEIAHQNWNGKNFKPEYFKSNFGESHGFGIRSAQWQGNQFHSGSRFMFGGAWFVLGEDLPLDWYSCNTYINEYEGGYALYCPEYPGVPFGITVVF